MAIDWNFLQRVEGKENTTYIPTNPDGSVIQDSGVTVGTGVDLGKQTAEKFRKLGISEDIIQKLKPFFKKSKDEAKKVLEKTGSVSLSDEEVFEIDKALKQSTLDEVKKWYNKDNKLGQDWGDLTDRQQTVVFSTFYNHGLGGAPNFKSQIEQGDWSAAIENLRNFYRTKDNELHSRRVKEAQYLAGLSGEQIDGQDGPITAKAVEKFKNTVGVSTPDQVQPQQPQIGSMEYMDNLMATLRNDLQPSQSGRETPSRGDTQAEPAEQDRFAAFHDKMRGLVNRSRSDDEARLEREANEAELAATARESEREFGFPGEEAEEPTPEAAPKQESRKSSVDRGLRKIIESRNKNNDRQVPNGRERQRTAGNQARESGDRDPIFGIF